MKKVANQEVSRILKSDFKNTNEDLKAFVEASYVLEILHDLP